MRITHKGVTVTVADELDLPRQLDALKRITASR